MEGAEAFEDAYVKAFFEEFDRILLKAMEENREDYSRYYGKDERTLILRILDYKDNYLSWVVNFDLPFSNYRNGINETEALLRLCEGNPYTVEEIFANAG